MIFLKKDIPLKVQIQKDIQELENCKNTYMQKIYEYKEGTNDINSLLNEPQCVQVTDTVSKNSVEKIKIYNTQILVIEKKLALLNDILENVDNLNEDELMDNLKNYNKEFIEIKRNIDINIFNSAPNKDDIFQQNVQKNYNVNKEIKEEVVGNEMNNVVENEETSGDMNNNLSHIEKSDDINEIQNNDTLLISEILNAVVLPFTAEEVLEILENENYRTAEEVIEDRFTRPLSDYKFQLLSRFNETIKLLTVRQDYKLGESIALALEIMKKRFLHPAIISACRSLDELDVYLDCLEKNELDDFKIFKIKYELHPILVKNGGRNKKWGV